MAVRWLEAKAGETDTQWDDIIIAAIGTPVQVAHHRDNVIFRSHLVRYPPAEPAVDP